MRILASTRTAGIGLFAVLAFSACSTTESVDEPTRVVQPSTTTTPTEPASAPDDDPSDPEEPVDPSEPSDADEPFDPLAGEPAPSLPESFGEWTTTDSAGGGLSYYEHTADGTVFDASVWIYVTREQIQDEAGADSELVGEWYCGAPERDPDAMSCTANAFDGAIQLNSNDLAAADLAAAGDELWAVWE